MASCEGDMTIQSSTAVIADAAGDTELPRGLASSAK